MDENGDYIYEFRYNVEVDVDGRGMIIYPETIIKKEGIEPNGRCIIEWLVIINTIMTEILIEKMHGKRQEHCLFDLKNSLNVIY